MIRLKVGDTAPELQSTLTVRGERVDFNTVSEVTFRMFDEYEDIVIEDDTSGNVTIENTTDGEVSYQWRDSETKQVGEYDAEWELLYNDGRTITVPNDHFITVVISE